MKLMSSVNTYPDVKASKGFLFSLGNGLRYTRETISQSRQARNDI